MTISHDDSLIIRTWYEIAVHALESRASDIHIEAGPQGTVVRIRVDGLLQVQSQYQIELHERLITRIKILARLDIAEKRLPQDGRLLIGQDFAKPSMVKKQLSESYRVALKNLVLSKLVCYRNNSKFFKKH